MFSAQRLISKLDSAFVSQSELNSSGAIGCASVWFPTSYQDYWYLYTTYRNLLFANSGWCSYLNFATGKDIVPPANPNDIQIDQIMGSILVRWDPVIDPDNVLYHVKVHTTMQETERVTTGSQIIIPIIESGVISISVEDESGNRSEEIEQVFQYNNPVVQMFIAPNPTDNHTVPSIALLLKKNATDPIIRLYDISGCLLLERHLSTP